MPEAKQIILKDLLLAKAEDPNLIIIDVRDAEKFSQGHIPGAMNIHKTVIAEEIANAVTDRNARIVCHCGGGESGPRSAEALAAMGYENVSYLVGGFRGYEASGEEIESKIFY
jgi:rhodanese-related sulfurtransferase